MANTSYAELMESLNADLTNKMIVEKANPSEERHYLALLEKSYASYIDTFQKYLNSSVVAKHSDVKVLFEDAQKMKDRINNINELINLKALDNLNG